MAFCKDVPGVEPRVNQDENQGEEVESEGNTQIPQPTQPIPTPVQENSTQEDEPETPAPPPPLEEEESEMEPDGNTYPSKFWRAFPQRIDADGPPSEIIWNPGGWELPHGTLQSGQGGQVAIELPDSFPTPHRMFLRVVSCWENEYHKSSAPGHQYQFS